MMFCTVIAQNFLPYARVLAHTLREHHPDAELDVLVVDAPAQTPLSGEPFRQTSLSELPLAREEIHRRQTLYDVTELASSLRGPLIAGLLARSGGPVLYLDADMLVLASLADIEALALRHGIVLTPHAAVPLPYEPGGFGPEQQFMRASVFNGGFLAVSPAAADFLTWRDQRAARDALVAPERQLVTAQSWLALVPALFDHVVLRDRGVNLMGHGMADDDLTWRDDRPWIGDTPVRLFHFAGGFEPGRGWRKAPAWWPRLIDRPGIARLCQDYEQRLLRAGFGAEKAGHQEGLDRFIRGAYRRALIETEARGLAEPPNPFTHGQDAFTAWLLGPAWPGSALSRYLAAVHTARPDLRAAFPRVPGRDEQALLQWVADKYGGALPAGLPTAVALR